MTDSIVILGTVAIVAAAAVIVVAIVYGRPLWINATRSSVDVRTVPQVNDDSIVQTDPEALDMINPTKSQTIAGSR